ncbi:hypothetical protein CYANOKiyG1_56700 [Okeania sp. KiyG1]|nr:hypothetical protein CYANOKiyG1_56700 [Okeania sp. KiyG1]
MEGIGMEEIGMEGIGMEGIGMEGERTDNFCAIIPKNNAIGTYAQPLYLVGALTIVMRKLSAVCWRKAPNGAPTDGVEFNILRKSCRH